MNCKKCQEELAEGNPICPSCGEDNSEPETAEAEVITPAEETAVQEPAAEETSEEEVPAEEVPGEEAPAQESPKAKKKTWKIVALVAGCVVLLAALAVGIFYVVNDGFEIRENNIQRKDVYTVEDAEVQEAADTVVATMGDEELTNAELQVFYWMQVYDFLDYYGSYLSYVGLDYTKPFSEQVMSGEDGLTWEQYFLEAALKNWQRYEALGIMADADSYEMETELSDYLENLPESLKASAEDYGYETVDEMIQYDMGPGANAVAYENYVQVYYKGYSYFSAEFAKMDPTDDEIEAYFARNEETLANSGITKDSGKWVDARHILVIPEGGTTGEDGTTVTYSDEEWEACREKAQGILDQWLAGEATEESFAALANELSEDTGSNTNGGLYQQMYKNQMVEEFEDWCFDDSRQYGDYGLVQTPYGYHVMFFVSSVDQWYETSRSNLMSETMDNRVNETIEANPMKVNYNKIVLGNVDLVA